jgi:hypothetical protein
MSDEKSGDVRIWSTRYESALRHIETGNVVEARKILTQLANDAPDDDVRKKAAAELEQFKPDWLAYAFLGGTLLVLIIIVIKYVF